ncbi:MAG: M81 family metallopeptidase, partial [Chloroflexota bacterium]
MKRIALGGIVHETNTFAPILTPLAAFTQTESDALIERWSGSYSSLGGALQGIVDANYEPVPLLYATAMPSGLVTRDAYHSLLDRLITLLIASAPVDGVLFVLHGAMVAEGQDDCEAEILERVRAVAPWGASRDAR